MKIKTITFPLLMLVLLSCKTASRPATQKVASGTSVSGEPVPVGDLAEWKQIFYDDFTKEAPLGSWANDCEPDRIVYTGAQGQQWKTYPRCFKDTYQKRPYRADSVLSVKNGTLNFYLHTVDGLPAGANPSPVIYNGSQYQTYGRYTARFKVDNDSLNQYYVAWLLWPETEKWPDDGEEDFPEGHLSGNVGGFHHYAGAGACIGCQDEATTTAKFTDWHTYTIEWRPGNIKYFLDGKMILNSDKWVPDKPMRWQLQTETKGEGVHSGNLIVDWVAVYKYAP
ncbi:MAG: glycoside hydrolase family 16 protein [Niabella sp.]